MKLGIAALLLALQGSAGFEPAQLVSGEVKPPPWATAVAGTAALELTVDESGAVAAVDVLDDLEPFTSLLSEVAVSWRFRPATEGGRPVESKVLIGGLFRPRMLLFPDPGPPADLVRQPSREVPFPTDIEVAPYPPTATGSAMLLVEVEVDAQGRVAGSRSTGEGSPFADAAVAAVKKWRFRPGRRNGRAVPGNVYVAFTFPAPQ